MRINTDEPYDNRPQLYERAASVLGEDTKSKGLDRAARHVREDIQNKEDVLNWLREQVIHGPLAVEDAQQLADLLSTCEVSLSISDDLEIELNTSSF